MAVKEPQRSCRRLTSQTGDESLNGCTTITFDAK